MIRRSLQRKNLYGICGFALVLGITAATAFAAAQQRFDRLKEADRKRFSQRFAKEIWPFLNRRGKDGCVGCHKPNHRSNLRLTGKPDADFRFMLRQGFFLPDDAGSVLHAVSTNGRLERMPPGNRPRWTKKEIAALQRFVIDLDNQQQK